MKKEGWTSDFCLVCGKRMRKWITHEDRVLKGDIYVPVPESAICQSMCINPDCPEKGEVYRTIQNQKAFKIKIEVSCQL